MCYLKKKVLLLLNTNFTKFKCNPFFVSFEGTIIANKPATRTIKEPKVATTPSVSVIEDIENVSEDELSEEEFDNSSDFQ